MRSLIIFAKTYIQSFVVHSYYQYRGNISSLFSSNSEADASELLENIEEMFLHGSDGDVIRRLKSLTTHTGV